MKRIAGWTSLVVVLLGCGGAPPPQPPSAPAPEPTPTSEPTKQPEPAKTEPTPNADTEREAQKQKDLEAQKQKDLEAQKQKDLEEQQRKAADEASGVPGANLRVNNVTTNGVTVEQIACKSEGGAGLGLLGSLVLGKPFADKKTALDACAKTPHKTRVRWVAKGGKMTEVKVISGDDPSNKCIERAMTGALSPVPGTCAATLEVGRAKK